LERVFIERLRVDDESASFTLVDALKTTEVKHATVPSLHLARLPGPQAVMRDHIRGRFLSPDAVGRRASRVSGRAVDRFFRQPWVDVFAGGVPAGQAQLVMWPAGP
jgi:hypothetical protein